jgi:subtilase family serine protease
MIRTGLPIQAISRRPRLSLIPEGAWNEPGTTAPFQTAGTGGGASLVIGKPTWQTGTGTLNDGHRDTPDVAYPAGQHDAYFGCLDYATGNASQNCTTAGGDYFFGFAGTGAAASAMAGLAALLNTKLGAAQGNLNPVLYTLAATPSNNIFHDITPPPPASLAARSLFPPCATTARRVRARSPQRLPGASRASPSQPAGIQQPAGAPST